MRELRERYVLEHWEHFEKRQGFREGMRQTPEELTQKADREWLQAAQRIEKEGK